MRAIRSSMLNVSFCRVSIILCLSAFSANVSADDAAAIKAEPHDSIERRIAKEPEYVSTPRYALLMLDAEANSRVWIVEDGARLFIDRNGNSDLTDDGPPLEPQSRRDHPNAPEGHYWSFEYLLDEFAPNGMAVTNFRMGHWKQGQEPDRHSLALTLNGIRPMYAGWFGLFSDSIATAPVLHLGGNLRPRKLRGQEFVLGGGKQRLSIAFVNHGRSIAEHARLSIEALPATVVPVAEIDWPVAPGQPALHTTHELIERCCYWEFYDSGFEVPAGAAAGMATVTISLPTAVLPFEFETQTIEVPVLNPANAPEDSVTATQK